MTSRPFHPCFIGVHRWQKSSVADIPATEAHGWNTDHYLSENQAICVHLFNLRIARTLSNAARRMYHD